MDLYGVRVQRCEELERERKIASEREREKCLEAEKMRENENPETLKHLTSEGFFFFFMGRAGLNLGILFLG